MTINVNKKKSSSRSYIFHCSEQWKYKFYIFTSENITFSKYEFYFMNNSLYFITLYIINGQNPLVQTNFTCPNTDIFLISPQKCKLQVIIRSALLKYSKALLMSSYNISLLWRNKKNIIWKVISHIVEVMMKYLSQDKYTEISYLLSGKGDRWDK